LTKAAIVAQDAKNPPEGGFFIVKAFLIGADFDD
jgi:hypothetical protein